MRELPLVSKIILGHGLLDALAPNPLTAAPLIRLLDRQHRSKKKRGWAWFYLMCGLMKVQGALTGPAAAAHGAGWAYAMQAVAMVVEGFFHESILRPAKVLGSTICFCTGMWVWLQVSAWRHMRRQLSMTYSNLGVGDQQPLPAVPAQLASQPVIASQQEIELADRAKQA